MDFEYFMYLYQDADRWEEADFINRHAGRGVELSNLSLIRELATSSMRDVTAVEGLPQRKFSDKYGIPLRTVENWIRETSTPPDYVRILLSYAIFADMTLDKRTGTNEAGG